MKICRVKRPPSKLARIFGKVRSLVASKFPALARVELYMGCPEAELSHKKRGKTRYDRQAHTRLYAHAGHVPDHICVSSHINRELKRDELYGMLLHEFGHAIADELKIENTQDAADGLIWKYFKIPIYYRMPRRIEYVEGLRPQKRPKAGRKSRFQNYAANPWYITDEKGVVNQGPYFEAIEAAGASRQMEEAEKLYGKRPRTRSIRYTNKASPRRGDILERDGTVRFSDNPIIVNIAGKSQPLDEGAVRKLADTFSFPDVVLAKLMDDFEHSMAVFDSYAEVLFWIFSSALMSGWESNDPGRAIKKHDVVAFWKLLPHGLVFDTTVIDDVKPHPASGLSAVTEEGTFNSRRLVFIKDQPNGSQMWVFNVEMQLS